MSQSPYAVAAQLGEQLRRADAPTRFVPVADPLAGLLPGGGLRRGAVTTVTDSAGLLLALLARACTEGAWCALVGLPEVGLLAATELGVDLQRLALVPDPGPDWLAVTAALVDTFDLVVLAPPRAAAPAQARRLAARLRERRTVLLVLLAHGSWPGAEIGLRVVDIRWEGMGPGYGRLTGYDAEVESRGRGAASRPRRVRVRLGGTPAPTGLPAPELPSPGRAA